MISAPRNVTVEAVTANSAIVSWTYVNPIFSDYEIVLTQIIMDDDDDVDSGSSMPECKTHTVKKSDSYQLTDLVPSTRYLVKVASIKNPELSFGPYSDAVVFTTLSAE